MLVNDKINKRIRVSESLNCLIAKRGVAISGFPGLEDVQDVCFKCDVLNIHLIFNNLFSI